MERQSRQRQLVNNDACGKSGGNAVDTVDKISKALDDLSKNPGGGLVKDNSVLGLILGGSAKSSAEKTIKNVDQALADMVKNGSASEAAAALAKFQEESGKKIPTDDLKKYASAQKDVAFEAQLTAQSLGLFGEQSIAVQKKLDSQKKSAQGLQQAIFDLNDAYRSGLDTMSSYQQALDDATAALKGHSNALHFTNGELDLTAQAARDVYDPMSKVASTAEAAAAAAVTQGKGQAYANKILIDAHTQLVKMGTQAGLTTKEAKKLADGLDNIKDPKIKMTATATQLNNTINAANKKLAAMPKSRTAALKADAAQLNNVIADARKRLDALNGKTAHTYITTTYVSGVGNVAHEGGGYATGGPVGLGRRAGRAAVGGPRNNLTWVGENGPELADLAPGSSVLPHANSMMAGAGSGSGSGAPIYLTVMLGNKDLGAAMIDPLRGVIKDRGGNVQIVLGQRGK